jgi:two-component system, response regulator PdtaR
MATKELTVLIGEDEGIIALDVQRQLQTLGYEVVIRSGTPVEIVMMAKEVRPDVIVLDLNITGDMHGVQVARDIHAIANIPIVFVTALTADIVEKQSGLPAPYRYLIKPFRIEDLHAAIHELLIQTE